MSNENSHQEEPSQLSDADRMALLGKAFGRTPVAPPQQQPMPAPLREEIHPSLLNQRLAQMPIAPPPGYPYGYPSPRRFEKKHASLKEAVFASLESAPMIDPATAGQVDVSESEIDGIREIALGSFDKGIIRKLRYLR